MKGGAKAMRETTREVVSHNKAAKNTEGRETNSQTGNHESLTNRTRDTVVYPNMDMRRSCSNMR